VKKSVCARCAVVWFIGLGLSGCMLPQPDTPPIPPVFRPGAPGVPLVTRPSETLKESAAIAETLKPRLPEAGLDRAVENDAVGRDVSGEMPPLSGDLVSGALSPALPPRDVESGVIAPVLAPGNASAGGGLSVPDTAAPPMSSSEPVPPGGGSQTAASASLFVEFYGAEAASVSAFSLIETAGLMNRVASAPWQIEVPLGVYSLEVQVVEKVLRASQSLDLSAPGSYRARIQLENGTLQVKVTRD
jgi:hypothetical protein